MRLIALVRIVVVFGRNLQFFFFRLLLNSLFFFFSIPPCCAVTAEIPRSEVTLN